MNQSPTKRRFRFAEKWAENIGQPLNKTIRLVEARLADTTSENPVRDLAFLSEHYHARGEWDKASAASRQMLKIAEGDTETKFEVTPLDVDLLLDKKRYQRALLRKYSPLFYLLFVVAFTIAGFGLTLEQHPEWPTIFLADLCPWNCEALLNRAEYSIDQRNWQSASTDCDRALVLSPNNKRAHRLKAQVEFDQGAFDSALQLVNFCSPTDIKAMRLKAAILFAQGDFRAAAILPFQVLDTGKTALNSWDTINGAFAFARAGDYEAALAGAQKSLTIATNDHQRCAAHTDQARYLVHLQHFYEANAEAEKALTCGSENSYLNCKVDAYLFRGEARLAFGDARGALEDANRSISYNHYDGRQFTLRGLAQMQLGKDAEAQESIRLANYFGYAPRNDI
jgi:tetratricopeptide (TPR) repeat protein